jgi:hypothetical protein
MSRGFLTVVLAAAGVAAFGLPAMAQFNPLPGLTGPTDPAQSTTVHGSKSNSSDRMGGGGGRGGGGSQTTTVKSSKSNSSDRMGGGGGRGGPKPAKSINLNSSRSNIY